MHARTCMCVYIYLYIYIYTYFVIDKIARILFRNKNKNVLLISTNISIK